MASTVALTAATCVLPQVASAAQEVIQLAEVRVLEWMIINDSDIG